MPVDELTQLAIRVTNLDERFNIIASKCDRTEYKTEDMLSEIKDLLRAWKEEKKDMDNKINIIAKAVKKLAQEQGRLLGKKVDS